MNPEISVRTRTDATEQVDRQRAAGAATSLIRAHYDDPAHISQFHGGHFASFSWCRLLSRLDGP